MLLIVILICVSQILVGVALSKPVGWVVLALGVVELLLAVGAWHQLRP